MTTPQRWDVFCSIVDNYGDAGVAWRLARQLVAEHRRHVRLFIDVLPVLARIAPDVDPSRDRQQVQGVDVVRWGGADGPMPPTTPADAVIEAFGCGVPPSYLDAMSVRAAPPVWINLEYLSAESWIEGCHGLVSRHPRLPLQRHFYFPGFTEQSGGLLREASLLSRRDAFQTDAAARAAFWRSLRVAPPPEGALAISLFCYPNRHLSPLLDAWADGDVPICCIVPEGVAAGELDRWTGGAVPHAGQVVERGRLSLAGIAFAAQDVYDRLLWACDLNLVRGEDSFVRALWAARPYAWQPYPQPDNAQQAKLEAFLQCYVRAMPQPSAASFLAWHRAWNDAAAADASPDADASAARLWGALAGELPRLAEHARRWTAELATQPDLAVRLVRMVDGLV
ncbi:MAG: elongation factor P maturation arginine rhamnosyltransferase EarP [Betaproteobacteria bacterium]